MGVGGSRSFLSVKETQSLLEDEYTLVVDGFNRMCVGQTLDVARFQRAVLGAFPGMVRSSLLDLFTFALVLIGLPAACTPRRSPLQGLLWANKHLYRDERLRLQHSCTDQGDQGDPSSVLVSNL